jgi:hypothetical protein
MTALNVWTSFFLILSASAVAWPFIHPLESEGKIGNAWTTQRTGHTFYEAE